MSTKRKRAVLSIKDKQIIISRLDKGEKGTNLAQEFGISKQQISYRQDPKIYWQLQGKWRVKMKVPEAGQQ